MDRIRQLARKWGTRIRKRSCIDYAFNGKTIAELDAAEKPKRRSDSNLIHDIAHFVVADPERRTIPEFGLGDSPDTGRFNTPMTKGMTPKKAQDEEELASALGIYWERELGLDWRETFGEHMWDDIFMFMPDEEYKIFDFDAKHKFAKQLRELRKRQII